MAGTSVLILAGKDNELIEVKFEGKPSLQDLVVFLALRGWRESSSLLFMSANAEDTVFLAMSEKEVLAIMSKELCDLFQDNFCCKFLTYKEIVEMLARAEQ